MLISETMNQRLNKQMTNEFYAAHLYLDMSCAFIDRGLNIIARWFRGHAHEERVHAMKIFDYVHEVGGHVRLDAIPQPAERPASVEEIVQAALDHELLVTGQINDLMSLADSEKDYATRSFLQWFVDEQVEEVSVVTEVLRLIKLAEGKHMLEVEARVAKMLETPA